MWAFIVIAAVYLVIVQGVSKLLTAGQHIAYAAPTSVNELWRSITVPVLVSLVFVSAAGCGSSRSSSPSPPWPG